MTMKKLFIIAVLLCNNFNQVLAQNNFGNYWAFSSRIGLDWSTLPPVFDGNVAIDSPNYYGTAVQCDMNGNLLFYCDGPNVFNRFHQRMPNGFGLSFRIPNIQRSMIVPSYTDANKYYIFSNSTITPNLVYCEIDMQLDGGRGDVVVGRKNIFADSFLRTDEPLSGARHANGRDFWIQTKDADFNFYATLVSGNGVGPTVKTTFATRPFQHATWLTGKSSYNGKKTVIAYGDMFLLLDFDPATGYFTSWDTIRFGPFDPSLYPWRGGSGWSEAYGIAYSANDSLVYISARSFDAPMPWPSYGGIIQYQLYATDVQASAYYIPGSSRGPRPVPHNPTFPGNGAMQMAVDGKIYINWGHTDTLRVIANPNGVGAACNFNVFGASTGGNRNYAGLPHYLDALLVPGDYTGCVPLSVTFSNPFPGAQSYRWYFPDDSSSSTQATPTHVFRRTGQFGVQCVATYATGVDSTFKLVEAYGSPGDYYRISFDTVCQGQSSTVTIDTLGWLNMRISLIDSSGTLLASDLSGGTHSLLLPYSQRVGAVGRNTLTGCIDTLWHAVSIKPSPNAGFTLDSLVCAPYSAHLLPHDSSYSSYSWGINGTSTSLGAPGAYHPNLLANSYSISLTTSNKGCSSTHTDTIQVLPKPTAALLVSDSVWCKHVALRLVNDNTGEVSSSVSSIYYGDGSSQSLAQGWTSTSHTYTQVGSYSLYSIHSNGTCSDTSAINTVRILDAPKPGLTSSSHAVLNKRIVTCPDSIVVQSQASGALDSIVLNMGNGIVVSSPDSSLAYGSYYGQPGNYSIVQYCYGPSGCISSDTLYVNIKNPPNGSLSISQSDSCGRIRVGLSYSGSHTDSISISWGDGSTSINANPNQLPSHNYHQNGSYALVATLMGNGCQDTLQATVNISITPGPGLSTQLDNSRLCLGAALMLSYQTSGPTDSIVISWGDGSQSRGSSPQQHSYQQSGIYRIQVTAYGPTGCLSSESQLVEVSARIDQQPQLSPIQGCTPLTITLRERSINFDSLHIHWGDGMEQHLGAIQQVQHTYTQLGIYRVKLIYSNSSCSDSSIFTIRANGFDGSATSTLLRASNVPEGIEVVWHKQAQAQDYIVYRDQIEIRRTQDSSIVDTRASISQIHTYHIEAQDSCGNRSPSENIAQNIVLSGSDQASLEWNQYRAWRSGVRSYTLSKSSSFSGTTSSIITSDTSYLDSDFNDPEAGLQCYTVLAQGDLAGQYSLSNELCLAPAPTIFVPTAFSPNADGLNEEMNIKTSSISSYTIEIYNRWGEQIYRWGKGQSAWNGKYMGQEVPAGLYIWKITATTATGSTLNQHGTVVVLK